MEAKKEDLNMNEIKVVHTEEKAEPEKMDEKKQKFNDEDTNYFVEKIVIPRDYSESQSDDDQSYKFSWKRLWAFTGPGFLMSIGYLDPGNIESDLQQGAIAKYKLLWVLLLSTGIGLLMQVLAARLGTVTGKHLAEVCYQRYPRIPRLVLWVMVEIAIIGSDMQEVIGTSIAWYIISKGAIPLYGGVLITVCDTFLFLFLDRYGLRKLEGFFGILITTMGLAFGYEYITVKPDQGDLLKHMFVPSCTDCNKEVTLQAIGIIGAIIMPHNFFLHSALVKSRHVERKNRRAVREANFYFFLESAIALATSFMINVFVVAVFAKAFYGSTYDSVFASCLQNPNPFIHVFNKNGTGMGNQTIDANLFNGGVFLGCRFGTAAMYIWAIGLLAAGQSSTMTGTYSGQFAMQGFLRLDWQRWKRVLFMRGIAVAPTFAIAFARGIDHLSGFNDLLNIMQSLQLPFAVIPLLTFTNDSEVMGEHKNNRFIKYLTWFLAAIIIGINIYFTIVTLKDIENAYLFIPIGILVFIWVGFYIFLAYYAVRTSMDRDRERPCKNRRGSCCVQEIHDNPNLEL